MSFPYCVEIRVTHKHCYYTAFNPCDSQTLLLLMRSLPYIRLPHFSNTRQCDPDHPHYYRQNNPLPPGTRSEIGQWRRLYESGNVSLCDNLFYFYT